MSDLPLSVTHPEMAAQWIPDLNGERTPDNTSISYGFGIWWRCEFGHAWRIAPNRRRATNSGCLVCSQRTVRPGVNDLATRDPELAAEWHPKLNGVLVSDVVHPGYKGEVYWLIESCGHWFPRSPAARKQDRRCPVCLDKRVFPGQNDVATLLADVVDEIHPTKNGADFDPTQERASSRRAIYWVNDCGHRYRAAPGDRLTDRAKPRCSMCVKRPVRVTSPENLLPLDVGKPELMPFWDDEANAPLAPKDVKAGDNRTLVTWRCPDFGHTWERRPRTQKPHCAVCADEVLLAGFNDLGTRNPALAEQWHPTENGTLRPSDVLSQANVVVYWLGPCGHTWDAKVANRSRGSGCRWKCPGVARPLPGF